MPLNFGTLNDVFEANSYVFLEAVARNGILDAELGVVEQGGVARWDRDHYEAAQHAARLLGRQVFKKNPVELALPGSINRTALNALLKAEARPVSSRDELNLLIQNVYKRAIEGRLFFPGPYGDFIQAIAKKNDDDSVSVMVSGIFQKAFPLMKAASDLIITVEGVDGLGNHVVNLVTGIRAQDPGKGKAAFFGGFRNVRRDAVESAFYAAIREGKEEAGIEVSVDNIETYLQKYDIQEATANASIFGVSYPSKIEYLKTIPTSGLPLAAGGELLEDGSKRVHFTTGYICRIDMGSQISEFKKDAFHADDDIETIKVTNITNLVHVSQDRLDEAVSETLKDLTFGIAHHTDLFKSSVEHIRLKGRIVGAARVMTCWQKFCQIFSCCRT